MVTLQEVINTLNNVEVKGKHNMDRLLGAIMALEAIAYESEKKPVHPDKAEGSEDVSQTEP